MLSRYWLRGRRGSGGRRDGEDRSVYIDRYSKAETALILWLVGASLMDLLLTLIHLVAGGEEANGLMAWFLAHGGMWAFAAAKLTLTGTAAFFLILHVRFRGTLPALFALGSMYLFVLGYHVVAAMDRGAL